MQQHAPLWLPDHQLGVAATLTHADELIGQVADLLFEYQSQPDGIFGLQEVPAGRVSHTVVSSVAAIPRKIPLLVADALVALRAALEHALFAEVELRDGTLDERAARLVEIPASDTEEKFDEWLKKRARNGPESLRAGSDLVVRIQRLQPYNRKDAANHPLALLTLHTNHAKHRTPAVTAVRLAAMYREDQRPSSVRTLPKRPEVPLAVGEIIAETPRGSQIPVTLFPTVGINRPGTDRWPVLMKELDEIAHWVRTQAVPRLITGGEPPEPALPIRYDISVGHANERDAMVPSTMLTAAARHQQRLGAALVRKDLVGILSSMDDAPSDRQITAWLAHLSDDEVLERMSRIRPTEDHDPEIVIANFAAFEGLRAEALTFNSTGDTVSLPADQS